MIGLAISVWQAIFGGTTGVTLGEDPAPDAGEAVPTYYIYGFGAGNRTPPGGGFDFTAPTLSDPTDTATGISTADMSVSTNEEDGRLYVVVTMSVSPPSAAQVKAGLNNLGTAAAFADNQAIASIGTKTFSANGLAGSTFHATYFMHEDAAGNQSLVSAADGFTTDALAGPASVPTYYLYGFGTGTGLGGGGGEDFVPTFEILGF